MRLVLDVTDDGFAGSTALHLLFECGRYTALLALGEDAEPVGVRCVVALVSHIGQNLFDLIADLRFYVGDDVLKGVTIIGVT